MIRWMGAILVLWGGTLGLVLQLRERRRRTETLRTVTEAMRYLAEEIRMARTPLPCLMETVGERFPADTGEFFGRVAAAARSGESPECAWRRELELLPLAAEAKQVLRDVDLQGDAEKICNGISLATERLARSGEDQRR